MSDDSESTNPAPSDPQVAAERAVAEALERLQASRSESLDAQLDAAEAVHAALSAHLATGSANGGTPVPGRR